MAKDPQTEKREKSTDKQAVDPITGEASGKSKQAETAVESSKEQKTDSVTDEPVAEPAAEAKADSGKSEAAEDTASKEESKQAETAVESSKEQKTDPVTGEPVAEPAAETKADSGKSEAAEDTASEEESKQAETAVESSKEQKTDPVTGEPVAEPAAEAKAASGKSEAAEDTAAKEESKQAEVAAESGVKKANQTANQEDDAALNLINRAGLPDIDVVKGYLTRIYQATHGGKESFESILAEMPSTVLDYLEANNELLDQSMQAQSDEELKALFDAMSGAGGPVITPAEVKIEVPLTEQSVAFLMRQWAWSSIEISSKVAKQILGDREVARLYSQAGIPMLVKAGSEKEQPSVSFTMLGGKGFDEKLSNIEVLDSDVEDDATGALDGKIDIMRACVDMLVLAQSDKTVIKQGLREAQRNLWALSKVFDKSTEGFDPTEEDEKWLSKRTRHLQEAFSADLQAAPTHAATKQLGGTGQAREDDEETK